MLNPALSAVALSIFLTAAKAQPVTVRLVGGTYPQEGRLEVNYNGTWGRVCDHGFNNKAADVVCYSLGYGHSGGQFIINRFGRGSGPIWLENVQCNGTEKSIADCRHNGWGIHNCDYSDDVSVSCIMVRLVGGPSPREGRLEVYYDGAWGTVCDDEFNNKAARVVCYMLGYVDIGEFIGNRYGEGSGQIWLDDLQCRGTETSITYCQQSKWGSHNCRHHEDVSVSCIVEVMVRLVGGSNPREGRLGVLHNGTWGTVCDDGFTDAAARVACYSLGFGYDGRKMNIDIYGVGNGTIWLDDIECNGTERHIGQCSHRGWGVHNCTHDEDVAISCLPATSTTSVSSLSSPATVGGQQATTTTPVSSSSLSSATVGHPRAATTTPVSSLSSPATVGGPRATTTTPVSSSSSTAAESSASDSPIQSTTPPTSTSPTSIDNSTVSVENSEYFAIMIIVVVALVALMIFFCVAMTYCYCRRKRKREATQQPAISLQETSSETNRPPPTAPPAQDDQPPPYSTF